MNEWAESQNNNKSFVIIKTTLRGEYLPNEEMLLVVEIFIFITKSITVYNKEAVLSWSSNTFVLAWLYSLCFFWLFWLLYCAAAGALLIRIYCTDGPFGFHLHHYLLATLWLLWVGFMGFFRMEFSFDAEVLIVPFMGFFSKKGVAECNQSGFSIPFVWALLFSYI